MCVTERTENRVLFLLFEMIDEKKMGQRERSKLVNLPINLASLFFFFFFLMCVQFLTLAFFCIGSPADKADLEIGDEILEVNGKSLDGATHTEVISHIHQVFHNIFFFQTLLLMRKFNVGKGERPIL